MILTNVIYMKQENKTKIFKLCYGTITQLITFVQEQLF